MRYASARSMVLLRVRGATARGVKGRARGAWDWSSPVNRLDAELAELAAIDALGVAGEELVARLVVEADRDGTEGGVELVEGAVHRVDGKIAGEHAAVHAEGLDGDLEPGAQDVD